MLTYCYFSTYYSFIKYFLYFSSFIKIFFIYLQNITKIYLNEKKCDI